MHREKVPKFDTFLHIQHCNSRQICYNTPIPYTAKGDISKAQGIFAHPRPHRDVDRQIQEAFRKVTGQSPRNPRPQRNPEDEALIDLLSQEDAFPSQEPQMPLEPGYIPTVTNQDPEPDDCDPEESDWVDRAMALLG